MIITASTPGAPASPSFAEAPAGADSLALPAKEVRSGEVRTRFNNFRYGRYEMRTRPPSSNGNFISTLFVFRTPKFQEWREIDIELTADQPRSVYTNLIFANGTSLWNPNIEELVVSFPSGPGARPLPAGFANQGAFHDYGFEWLPDRVTWFVDDVPVRVTGPGGKLALPERAGHIVMNLWIFAIAGGFGGDPTRNAYPLTSEYEWFRFYRWDGEKTYPCAPAPACLPADDLDKSKNNPADGLPP
jgi:beta-glucanase (GH16 family)